MPPMTAGMPFTSTVSVGNAQSFWATRIERALSGRLTDELQRDRIGRVLEHAVDVHESRLPQHEPLGLKQAAP